MSLELFSQPLKPFPALLRAGPVSLEFDVMTHVTPGHSYASTNKIIDSFQRHDPGEHSVTKSFQRNTDDVCGFEQTRVSFNIGRTRPFWNCVHNHNRFHPVGSQNRIQSGEGGAFLPVLSCSPGFDQTKSDARQHRQRRCHIRNRRKIHTPLLRKRISLSERK